MPSKKKQTSRLNSVEENFCKYLPRVQRESPVPLEVERTEEEIFINETEASDEIEYQELKIELKMSLSRTTLLIREYREFKAARCIQRFVRGWLYRTQYKRKYLAVIVIQAEWRRFYSQRLYFRKVEETLQIRIEQHFHQSARKIQAFWRGWWVRHHVHDLTHLKHLQLLAAEDLLYCVAFKLHHLLRTHQIPGVYSLRNSNALSKVEQLLASLRFKAFNQRSLQAMKKCQREKREAEKQHKKSAFGTKIPFPKNDVSSVSKEKCFSLYTAKDVDIRMAKILQQYEQANREMSRPQAVKKKLTSYKQTLISVSPSESSSFCGDVVKSMKKWKIITEKNLIVDSNVFRKPENVENFLKEVGSKLSLIEDNRNCWNEILQNHKKAENLAQAKIPPCTNGNLHKSPVAEVDVRSPVQPPSECSIISSNIFTMDEDNNCFRKEVHREKGFSFSDASLHG